MQKIELGNIEIQFDYDKTKLYYDNKDCFTCDCPDCLDYVSKLSEVKNLMNGLDEKLGIDLSKNVAHGMEELSGINYKDHNLYVVPYYINGSCFVNGVKLAEKPYGPIMPETIRTKYKLDANLNLTIANASGYMDFEGAEFVLVIWVEFKTQLIKEAQQPLKKIINYNLWEKIKRLF